MWKTHLNCYQQIRCFPQGVVEILCKTFQPVEKIDEKQFFRFFHRADFPSPVEMWKTFT
jgi:hypothetical protein